MKQKASKSNIETFFNKNNYFYYYNYLPSNNNGVIAIEFTSLWSIRSNSKQGRTKQKKKRKPKKSSDEKIKRYKKYF